MPALTKEIIEAAIAGFESQKHHIDEQIAELKGLLPSGAKEESYAAPATRTGRRQMSAAGRRAIAEAQRKRWAAVKGETATAKPAKRTKRRLSAEGRANIIAALKKRWAAKKAAEASGAKTTRKRAA